MSSPRVSFRCPVQHITAARQRADSEGVSLSATLRSLLFHYATGQQPSPQLVRTSLRLNNELRRIGVNINQIAHALNAGLHAGLIDASVVPDLRRHLFYVATAIDEVRAVLHQHQP